MREPALLVVFAVVRQERLRHRPEQRAPGDRDRAVVEPPRPAQRRPDQEDRRQPGAGLGDLGERRLHGVEQRALLEQVVDGVGRDRELGEDREIDPRRVGPPRLLEDGVAVEADIGRPHPRRAGGDPHEAVPMHGVEVLGPGPVGHHRRIPALGGVFEDASGRATGGAKGTAIQPSLAPKLLVFHDPAFRSSRLGPGTWRLQSCGNRLRLPSERSSFTICAYSHRQCNSPSPRPYRLQCRAVEGAKRPKASARLALWPRRNNRASRPSVQKDDAGHPPFARSRRSPCLGVFAVVWVGDELSLARPVERRMPPETSKRRAITVPANRRFHMRE